MLVDFAKDGMGIAAALGAGLAAYAVAFLFDWAALRKLPVLKPAIVVVFLVLHGVALLAALWQVSRFALPGAVTAAGWALAALFGLLLVYSLALELPSRKTYSRTGVSDRLVTTGTYALTRHPVLLWYAGALASLVLATGSTVLLVAAPFWVLLNTLYVIVQDRFFFVRMFPGYRDYQSRTPMLCPTRGSLGECLRNMRARFFRAGGFDPFGRSAGALR